jgi:Arc/MetJ-type ribon-helix-helix transcriptional regulator
MLGNPVVASSEMKLSVSLSDEDVEFIDHYATDHGLETRSGVLRRALALLRATELGDEYAAAWEEWAEGEGDGWEATAPDGLEDGLDDGFEASRD